MESKEQYPVTSEGKRSKRIYLIIILLLFGACGFLGWQYWIQKRRADKEVVIKETIVVERENVKGELMQLQEDYASLQTNDKNLQTELEGKRAQIAQLIEQAEKHKGDAYIIGKLKKEAETLRKIMKGYIFTIDSLHTLNKTLIVEKEMIAAELTEEQGKAAKLNKEKEGLQGLVNLGSVLKASGMKATGVRFKTFQNTKKELETNKAKRSEKLKVTFTLGENRIAKGGARDIYVRVITPDGKELTSSADEAHIFRFNNSKGFYSAKETIYYENQDMDVKIYCDNPEGFLPGKYMIEVVSDEHIVGQTTLVLE